MTRTPQVPAPWSPHGRGDRMQAALDYIGVRVDGGGGGVKVLRHDHGETHTLITSDGSLPSALTDPVHVGLYDNETLELIGRVRDFPTLAHALLDLYGPCAGEPLPPALVACYGAVRRWTTLRALRREVAR